MWTGAGFSSGNLSFKPKNQSFTIKSQDPLVGGTYVACSSSIEVRDK
jgi:hypothetical protein